MSGRIFLMTFILVLFIAIGILALNLPKIIALIAIIGVGFFVYRAQRGGY